MRDWDKDSLIFGAVVTLVVLIVSSALLMTTVVESKTKVVVEQIKADAGGFHVCCPDK